MWPLFTPPSVWLRCHRFENELKIDGRRQRHICLWGRRFRHSITDIHTRWARASCPSPALPETAKMIVPLPLYTPFLTFKASARSTPHPDDWLFQPWMVSELILQSVPSVLVGYMMWSVLFLRAHWSCMILLLRGHTARKTYPTTPHVFLMWVVVSWYLTVQMFFSNVKFGLVSENQVLDRAYSTLLEKQT